MTFRSASNRMPIAVGMAIGIGCSPGPEELATTQAAEQVCTPSTCGQNSGLVPFHKDAIHASLVWRDETRCPKLLTAMRPSEYKPRDYLAPTVGGVFSGFNQTYISVVQGGFGLGQLDRSGWSRYSPDLDRENTQLVDVCGLQASIDAGAFTKQSISALTLEDISATDPFFKDAGYSKGLGYNIFCSGNVSGADGRIYFIGGHDKGGNNGLRKINAFDSESESWKQLPIPCVRSEWQQDPTGQAFGHCSALEEDNTDPPHVADMKYQRWYPTGVTLPDGRILILSGTDQNTEVGPQAAGATKVRYAVPEVYDPATGRSIALENAKRLQPMYPRSFVVQTGRGPNDWKVCSFGEAQPPLPGTPGGADITDYDPFAYNGRTSCLDVLGALADPNRNTPAANHWSYVDTALNAHDSGAAVMRVVVRADGTWSQRVFAFGGSNNLDVVDGVAVNAPNVATVESIDFAEPTPSWQQHEDLLVPTTQNLAVALPDGKIFVAGGRNSFQYQMFDPADGSVTGLISSPVPRHDHSTALAMPNGGVWIMGGNRVQLNPGGNENLAVPVLEFYRPPYWFKGPRPVITDAPDQIKYGKPFNVQVSGGTGAVEAIVLLRTGPVTHNWTWGNQAVSLPFTAGLAGKVTVTAPPLPGLAIPGRYMLFVVTQGGIPSEGKPVRLKLAR